MSYRIRQYVAQDNDAIASLHHTIYPAYGTQFDTWHAAVQYDERANQPERCVAVAEHQQPIGYGAIRSLRAHTARLDLMVHPHFQRQGVGQMLLDHLIERARHLNVMTIHLRARLDYLHALRFLIHRGFTETHRMYGMRLNVQEAHLAPLWPLVRRLGESGITITTLAHQRQHTPDYLQRLHTLQNAVGPDWPDPEGVAYTLVAYGPFVARFERETHACADTFFLATHGDTFIGYCGLSALGTAVHPSYRQRGVATALKLWAIAEAQKRGVATTMTCSANPAMVAINENLGYVHEMVEVRFGRPTA